MNYMEIGNNCGKCEFKLILKIEDSKVKVTK